MYALMVAWHPLPPPVQAWLVCTWTWGACLVLFLGVLRRARAARRLRQHTGEVRRPADAG
jgi:hypothetical protein